MAPTNVSSLTDPAVQISRSGFFKRNSLLHPWVTDPREQQRVPTKESIVVSPRQPRPTCSRFRIRKFTRAWESTLSWNQLHQQLPSLPLCGWPPPPSGL